MKFKAAAKPLDSRGLDEALSDLDADAADLWAVINVETSGCGFFSDRSVKILFERHIFHRETNGAFDAQAPALSNPQQGGYGEGGTAQYKRLKDAMALNEDAALRSTSWGLGQVMGFNASAVGFPDARAMVSAFVPSESAQVKAMARFIRHSGLAGALRSHDWVRFARGYNGSNFAINRYDTRLAGENEKLRRSGLPDLHVRAAQTYLTFLGFNPFGIDGVMGRLTRSAMNQYQATKGLPVTQDVDDPTLDALARDAAALAN